MGTESVLLPTPEAALLSHEETLALLKQAQNGCDESRKHLIERNVKLVLSVAHRFHYNKHSLDDLFQIGTIGLIKAVDHFDVERSVKFSTYAVPLIMGEIRRYVRDQGSIRVSRGLKEIASKVKRYMEEYQKSHGEDPSLAHMSEALGVEKEDILFSLEANAEVVSLSTPMENESGSSSELVERIEDPTDWQEDVDRKHVIQHAMMELEEREKDIITLRYYEDKTQMEIGEELGISQAHVSRLEKEALKKMKKVM